MRTNTRRRWLGYIALIGAVLSSSQAMASAPASCGGISSISQTVGAFSNFYTSSSNFRVGDTITVSIPAGQDVQAEIWAGSSGTFVSYWSNSGYSTTFTLGTGQTSLDIEYANYSTSPVTITATCTSAAVASSDSDKARAVQSIGSRLVARQSSTSISDATNSAITGQLFGAPAGLKPSLPPSNLGGPGTPERAAQQLPDDGAVDRSYLGAEPRMRPSFAPRGQVRVGNLEFWSEARGTGILDRESGSGGISGGQLNVTSGVGLQVRPGLVVGALTSFEHLDYEFRSLGGTLKGSGYSGGLYVGGKIVPSAWYTLVGTYTRLGYDITAGSAAGNFNADRWMVSGTVAGRMPLRGGAAYAEPSANLLYVRETQAAWRDTLGTDQSGRTFDEGRFSVGSKIATDMRIASGILTPHVGAYADYYFGHNTDVPTGIDGLGVNHNWSLRTVAGISLALDDGYTIKLDGSIGGIGDNTQTYSGRASFTTRF